MGLFSNENSIEPESSGAARKARSEQPAIREATGAELAGATQRRDPTTSAAPGKVAAALAHRPNALCQAA